MRGRLVTTLMAGVVLGGLTLTGCSGSVSIGGSTSLTHTQVEDQIVSSYAEQTGSTPTASCPGDLAGKVGATMTCTIDDQGDKIQVETKVTSVDGTKVLFDTTPIDPSADASPTAP